MTPEQAVIKLLLTGENREEALEGLARLRLRYFSESFRGLFSAISNFYARHGHCPTTKELALRSFSVSKIQEAISVLDDVDVAGISLDLAIEALLDQFAQTTVLDLFSQTLDTLPMLSVHEIQEHIGTIPIRLEESIEVTESVYTSKDLRIFESQEETATSLVSFCISHELDAELGGSKLEDLVMIGGSRGSGKSLLGINICEKMQAKGFIAPFFTIEMDYKETFQRFMSVRSGLPISNIRGNNLSEQQRKELALARAKMHLGGEELWETYIAQKDPNWLAFEDKVSRLPEKSSTPIIIDSRELTLSAIDVQLGKLKSKYGDRFKLAVVDYINVVTIESNAGVDGYDWKPQIQVAKQLKNLARKYGIVIVTPYQIDASGEARFAKGILDSADLALTLKRNREEESENSTLGSITLQVVKKRNGRDDISVTVGIDWGNLIVDPTWRSSPVSNSGAGII